jgi:hypothetical protein
VYNIQPQSIIVSFKDANNKLKSSFVDQELPALPFAWIARVVFDVISHYGRGNYGAEEIAAMCMEIVDDWYMRVEVEEETGEVFTNTPLANMIQLRVTQYQIAVESELDNLGLFVHGRLHYQLKEFIDEDTGILALRQ